jgi:glycosyltransferase involved in cell wall biosynthesis
VREIGGPVGKRVMGVHYNIEDIYQMLKWQHAEALFDYDVVIQTKTNPYWYVPKDDQVVIRYNHSTPRNLYDQHWRRGGSFVGDSLKLVQRMLYQQVLPYATSWLANSDLVARRMRQYWDIDPEGVVYPPVDTQHADPGRRATGDYYVSIGRLDVNKRVDLLRDVAASVDKRIVVAGDGPQRDALEPMPDNLDYRGYVTEAEKWDLLAGAKATLFMAENEDFGIVPIESLASGTPVIAPREGFQEYQLHHKQDALFVDENPGVEDYTTAINHVERVGAPGRTAALTAYADRFSRDRFRDEIREYVTQAIEQAAVEPIEPPKIIQ